MNEEKPSLGPEKPVRTPKAWIGWADNDLAFARWGLQSDRPFAAQICYLCQQAVEKYLKGYLIAQGWMLEKTHSIAKLLTVCISVDGSFTQFENDLAPFDQYVTEARYPVDMAIEFSPEEARRAVEVAERLRNFVHKKLTSLYAE